MARLGTQVAFNEHGAGGRQPAISLAVPCYNEEAVLRRTVDRLIEEFRHRDVDVELVLVDNGSTDGTARIIDEMVAAGAPVTKAVVPTNIGYGYGVRVGLAACRGAVVGSIPADGQVDPRDVVNLYEVLANSREPRLAKVRRRFRMDGFKRKVISIIYNVGANVLFFGLGSIDINGTPKLFPREYLQRMKLESDDWFLDMEILIKAKDLGLPVFEQNVFAQMREGGQSNVRAQTVWEFIINLGRWRLLKRSRQSTPVVIESADRSTPGSQDATDLAEAR